MKLTAPSVYVFSALVALMFLAGCGIKPGTVSAPPGIEKDNFPHTYPDPSTDLADPQ